MFDWLFEGRISVFLLLALIAGVLGYLGWSLPNRRLVQAAGVCGFLILLYFLLNLLVETDREKIERKMTEIARDLSHQDTASVFKHMSEEFRFRQYDRTTMPRRTDEVVRQYQIRNVRIWDVEVKDMDHKKRTAKVTFSVKTDSSFSDAPPLLCRSEWVLDPDGEWRMKTFDLYNPFVDTTTPLQYPF